jgi:hypothetical protein
MLSPVSPPVSGRSNAPEIEPRSISEHDLYATATAGEAPISAACIGSFQIGSDRRQRTSNKPGADHQELFRPARYPARKFSRVFLLGIVVVVIVQPTTPGGTLLLISIAIAIVNVIMQGGRFVFGTPKGTPEPFGEQED